jgi:hypothetical protein
MANHRHLLMIAPGAGSIRRPAVTGDEARRTVLWATPKSERHVAALVGRRTWKGVPEWPRKVMDAGDQSGRRSRDGIVC